MAPQPPTPAPTAEEFAALKAQLEGFKALFGTANRANGATKHGAKPPPYEGSQEPRAIESWVQTIDDYFEMNPGNCSSPRLAVLTAASYLAGSAKADYNSYVAQNGQFADWDTLKKWLLVTFNPIDPINTYTFTWLYNLHQTQRESPDAYYRRYRDATNLLPEKLPDFLVRFHFAHTLITYYKTPVVSDTELNKWQKPLDAIVAKMKSLPPPPTSGQDLGGRIAAGNPSSSYNGKKRKLNSNFGPGGNNGGNNGNGNGNGNGKKARTRDDTPLTDGERRFLDTNISKGGGMFIRDAVQNKVAWIKEARERKLCIQCAASGHIKGPECQAKNSNFPQRNNNSGGTSSALNAIFPGMDSLNGNSQL
jgi:hypothetical protein